MATRIKLSGLEQRILDRVLLSGDGFERVEDLLTALDADRNQFVDALESLEEGGYLSVANFGGSIVVAASDPVIDPRAVDPRPFLCARVGQC